jgi:hypothetical protein
VDGAAVNATGECACRTSLLTIIDKYKQSNTVPLKQTA